MSLAVELQSVHKSFGPKTAVHELDLRIPRGALCGFIGPNGAGKTTTIRMIMSIIFPDRGNLRVLDRASALESKDQIGYLPEERGVYRKMKVGAFLNYMARLKGMPTNSTDQAVRAWLAKVGLGDCYTKKCEELSKGMQQKVQFVAAVIHGPELLILDEVFSGLDPVNRRLMRELILEQHTQGRTIIFSTHAMVEAEVLCDQIFMIHQGRKVLDGDLRQILAQFDPNALLVEPAYSGSGDAPANAHDAESHAIAAIGALPGIQSVRAGEGRGIDRGVLEVRLDPRLSPSQAMASIAAAISVRKLEIKRASLEDIFIDLVARDTAQQGDPAARDRLRAELTQAASAAEVAL